MFPRCEGFALQPLPFGALRSPAERADAAALYIASVVSAALLSPRRCACGCGRGVFTPENSSPNPTKPNPDSHHAGWFGISFGISTPATFHSSVLWGKMPIPANVRSP